MACLGNLSLTSSSPGASQLGPAQVFAPHRAFPWLPYSLSPIPDSPTQQHFHPWTSSVENLVQNKRRKLRAELRQRLLLLSYRGQS